MAVKVAINGFGRIGRLKKECRIFDDENSRQTELTAEFQVEP